jgi:hypothetical protein
VLQNGNARSTPGQARAANSGGEPPHSTGGRPQASMVADAGCACATPRLKKFNRVPLAVGGWLTSRQARLPGTTCRAPTTAKAMLVGSSEDFDG